MIEIPNHVVTNFNFYSTYNHQQITIKCDKYYNTEIPNSGDNTRFEVEKYIRVSHINIYHTLSHDFDIY